MSLFEKSSAKAFLTGGIGIHTKSYAVFDIQGIPTPPVRKFFAKLFFKKA